MKLNSSITLPQLSRQPQLNIIGWIIIVATIVACPASLFIPEPSDFPNLMEIAYVPVIALGLGLATIDIFWLLRLLLRRKFTGVHQLLAIATVLLLAAYSVYIITYHQLV